MRITAALTATVILGFGLTACSTVDDVFGGAPNSGIIAEEAPVVEKTPVVRIESLELGKLFRGYMLTATGVAPGTGFYEPELRIRYGGELGPDGFYEFDFVAIAPDDAQGANAPITARLLRSDFELPPAMLRSARGVRVWSSRDSVEGRF